MPNTGSITYLPVQISSNHFSATSTRGSYQIPKFAKS